MKLDFMPTDVYRFSGVSGQWNLQKVIMHMLPGRLVYPVVYECHGQRFSPRGR
jgi:hypothetical protein